MDCEVDCNVEAWVVNLGIEGIGCYRSNMVDCNSKLWAGL